jgi:peptidyl-dipeptidase A
MYPLPSGSSFKKNNHASAWHMNLAEDVRMLMSVESNSEWYETTHHEFGHIYYFLLYSNPEVPLLLRGGANRALHEAVGSLMGLAAMQPRFAAEVGLLSGDVKPDPIQSLLAEALNYVVFVPFATGLMAEWEHDLYAENLPPDQWNARWWELKKQKQGIVPPNHRPDSEYCDPPTKTHINDDAAQYYDYALSYLQLFQLHTHIARTVLHEDPHDTNYFGQKDIGDFLRKILSTGATVDWRTLLRETTGEDLSAKAMLDYFAPLQDWLEEENKGRTHTLPAL